MALDHGVLNIPLAKRGDIDAQTDKYKAQQARDARAKAKADATEMKTLRAKAKALLPTADAEMIARVAAKNGMTPAQVCASLKSDAHWNPAFVIRVLGGAA